MIKHNSTFRCLLLSLALSIGMCTMESSVFADESETSQETILFLGDSITAAGDYVRAIDAALQKQSPTNKYRIINRGLSSETVSGLSEACHPGVRPCLFSRLENELEIAKPDWVVACYGINDGIYHPYDESRFEVYKAGINRLIKEVHASGSHMILLTSPPYANAGPAFPDGTTDDTRNKLLAEANRQANAEAERNPNKYGYRTPYAYYDRVMETYATWLLTLNNQEDVWVIDLRKAMLPRINESHGRDPIHPNKIGHAIMADTFVKEWSGIRRDA
jgi:lysophospholipase L1-like esterase